MVSIRYRQGGWTFSPSPLIVVNRLTMLPGISVKLLGWIGGFPNENPTQFTSPEDRMCLVNDLARQHARAGTDDPFGAAIFSGSRLISVGMNLVTLLNCSVLHAEMAALISAQQTLCRHDISNGGQEDFDLISSAEPCAMCLGAVPWSGVRRLICGARDEDIRSIRFNEGIKPAGWIPGSGAWGISVQRDLLRNEAVAALKEYLAAGGYL